MKGSLITIAPGDAELAPVRDLAVDDIETMHDAVGGFIEAVPGFLSIEHDGAVRRCVAFCDEDGKRKKSPINVLATDLWHRALVRRGDPRGLQRPGGGLADYLVGTIAIVYGDPEFMRAL
jgi:hypothetical protein